MKITSVLHWNLPQRTLVVLKGLCILLCIGMAFYICTFKIMDRDFWWHITAGNIILHTKQMITIDPFAYTRAGLPYLATHEWLAQIALYLIYHLTGFTGIILFRAVIACASMGAILAISPKRIFPNALLALWGIMMMKGSFLERPQLFTFLIFSAFLFLCFRFLDTESMRNRIRICVALVVLELLWVNMHGGAALVGCALVFWLLLQSIWNARVRLQRTESRKIAWLLSGTLALMAVVLVLPPNGFGTFSYLHDLMNDRTIQFIAEWRPRDLPLYASELWLFWALSIFALLKGRRQLIFNTCLLLMTAYLSRQAFRHEILFVLSSTATVVYQCARGDVTHKLDTWMRKRNVLATLLTTCLIIFLGHHAYVRSMGFERQDNLFGFGQFDLARGAYDFIEKHNITGNMFNTYGIGGYLIYRGYPDRKVFVDGRNVDYGFDFLARTYAAGFDSVKWQELQDQHTVTYAIVDYDAIREQNRLPYSSHLDNNPDWAMVYLDDWVAVYLKRTPENLPLIKRFEYKYISATKIQFENSFAETAVTDLPAIRNELNRMQNDNLQGIKATMSLAHIALRENRVDDVLALVSKARTVRPYDPEPLAILAAVYVQRGEWSKAAETYDQIISLAGDNYPNINYVFIANIFKKAGHPWKAWYYRLGSTKDSTPPPTTETTSAPTAQDKVSLSVNPALDALEFLEKGLTEAAEGKLMEAEQSFLASLKLNPSSADTWSNMCALYIQQKRDTEAIDSCKRAIDINKKFADAHYNVAIAYYRTGNMSDAKKEALLAKKWGRQKEADDLLLLIKKKSL